MELSGIGNPTILSKFGIETDVDLPGVGENLRASDVAGYCRLYRPLHIEDHVGAPTMAEVNTSDETMDDLVDPEVLKKHEEL